MVQLLALRSEAGVCKELPAEVTDCDEYAKQGFNRECMFQGAGCVPRLASYTAWFSKTNTANPNQRVNAQQICRDQGYDGADARYYGGNWGHLCRHPGWNWWHYNKSGGTVQSLGSAVTWWCHGMRKCDNEPEEEPVADPNPCNAEEDLGKFFIDDCEKKCICEKEGDAFKHKCYLEREEFTDMSDDRRERFFNTFKAISTPGHESYDAYVELINLHPKGSDWDEGNIIHNDPYFLIWHRWYLKALEDLLQVEDCRVTLPWWRWSRKSSGWQEGAPFLDEDFWLGLDDKEDGCDWGGCCVTSGPFAYPDWSPAKTEWFDGCMRRNFQLHDMPTLSQITTVQNLPADNFVLYSQELESVIHNMVHWLIGGDMGSMSSPRNPEFFLHHAYIDRLWDQWQRKSDAHMEAYGDFPRDYIMRYTTENTPNNVKDHFKLKDSGVIYVDVQTAAGGEGRRRLVDGKQPKALPPMGNWIVQDGLVFDIREIEDAMLNISEDELLAIPQRPLHVPTFDDFEWMHPDFTEAQKAEFMARFSDVTDHIKSENDFMKSPTEEFSEGGSRALGFNLIEASRVLRVCHIGTMWDEAEGGCVKDPAQKSNVRKVKKALKHHVVVNGEVREPPEATTRRHIRNAKMKASEAENNPAIL